MPLQIITIYCLCADFLIAIGYEDDPQATMTTAEVMTTVLVAAACFTGNQELSRRFLKAHGYFPAMLSKSRLNRRLHAIPESLWTALFSVLAAIDQQTNTHKEYIVDSLPVPVCDNIRIKRCRLYRKERFRGYIASKRRYFYGLRVHLLVSATGMPVQLVLAPGADADLSVLRSMDLDLPEGALLYADKAYTDYVFEDLLSEVAGVQLLAHRKKNSKRSRPAWEQYICQKNRKQIETTFSQIALRLARSIHAVTARGFELKVFLTVLAYAICG
jgi:hypothetical protein